MRGCQIHKRGCYPNIQVDDIFRVARCRNQRKKVLFHGQTESHEASRINGNEVNCWMYDYIHSEVGGYPCTQKLNRLDGYIHLAGIVPMLDFKQFQQMVRKWKRYHILRVIHAQRIHHA